jgi:hexokinase
LDAGGTNLRCAKAEFDPEGSCHISNLYKTAMAGTRGELTFSEFYGELAGYVRNTGCTQRIGLCFSFNVLLERNLDGILHSWCKEVRVPEAVGKPVGVSLQQAVGPECRSVRVLNDSTAALLGAHHADPRIQVGLILGTGINVCYPESCEAIPKVSPDLHGNSMIICTEIGEFRGIPKTKFDWEVITASDEPEMAHAEKQCAGAYLGDLISKAWQTAVQEGILPGSFSADYSLPQISDYLAGENATIPESAAAKQIAETMIHRAAKIAAVLTAGPVLRSQPRGNCTLVIEGSQFHRLTGFGDHFRQELDALLKPRNITHTVTTTENSCLLGAALAAFAQPM